MLLAKTISLVTGCSSMTLHKRGIGSSHQASGGFYWVVVMAEVMTVIKIMLQMALGLQSS